LAMFRCFEFASFVDEHLIYNYYEVVLK